MNLDTYQSAAIPDVFVTVPSAEARALLVAVDKLVALRLRLVRPCYRLFSDAGNGAFMEFVSAEIALSGYAVHGFNVAFEQPGSGRRRAVLPSARKHRAPRAPRQ